MINTSNPEVLEQTKQKRGNEMTKSLFAIDLGNKTGKMMSDKKAPMAIPSRYIDAVYVDGSNRFESISGAFKDDLNVNVKKYNMVNSNASYYFGQGINSLGKDQYVRESFGVGKQRYEGQKFKDMLSFTIAELSFDPKNNGEISEAELVLGLPSEDFTETNIKSVMKYAKGQHSVEIDGVATNVKITKVHIIPQPVGTFYDLILDDNGKLIHSDYISQKTAIVDIGGLTKLFDSLMNFAMDTTEREQKDTGVWTLYNMVADMLDIDSSIKPNKYQIEAIIRTGVEKGGQSFAFKPKETGAEDTIIDMTEVIQRAIDLYTEQTIDEITNVFTHFSLIDNLVFTGGGSKILNKKMIKQAFPNTNIIFSDGEFANVNGFYKYGLTQQK